MIKSRSIDLNNLDSLKAAANVIFENYVTLLSIRLSFSDFSRDYVREFPFFDFETHGSFVTYPKSKLKQHIDHPYFSIVSLRSEYSLN